MDQAIWIVLVKDYEMVSEDDGIVMDSEVLWESAKKDCHLCRLRYRKAETEPDILLLIKWSKAL
ncbi:MAG: hypothetical protein ACLTQG_30665 [Hungatella sp.]|uniref:hypothetical protein n=1 Tax=Hungatella sp. TaxID=2613924 RepID=UPI0039938BB2